MADPADGLPIAAWRDAWHSTPAPTPRTDAAMDVAIVALRRAWLELQPGGDPSAAVRRLVRRVALRRSIRIAVGRAVLAASLVLALVGAWHGEVLRGSREVGPQLPSSVTPKHAALIAALAQAPVDPTRFEVRSGPVRLIVVQPRIVSASTADAGSLQE